MAQHVYSERFRPFADRMSDADLPPAFIASFARYFHQLELGHTGLISEADVGPVADLPDAEHLPDEFASLGVETLARVVVIKLNGGLGTGMGLRRAKSLLVVKNDLTFLDIIARQAIGTSVPLVLMNSFVTEAESLNVLQRYEQLDRGLPLGFRQHMVPKIRQDDLTPVSVPSQPGLEWCPPGHGDLYAALISSGTLTALLHAGRDYAFVSNADNLGAVIDPAILGYFHSNRLPFLMEVADRTDMDRKGGHLARMRSTGQLVLREAAQCPPVDQAAFQDVDRYRYFNTNNLWIDLRRLNRAMEERDTHLGLPMIRNGKTADPRDSDSTPVWQLETAMGAAIGVFEGAGAIRVTRNRFAPVKATDDLLAVRSDAYVLDNDARIVPNPSRTLPPPMVELDPAHYRFVSDLDDRFPHGAPSLVGCRRCRIVGEFRFGRDVQFVGDVELENLSGSPIEVPDGSRVTGHRVYRPNS